MFSPRKSGRPFQAFDWFRVWLSLPLGPGHQEAGGALQVPQGQAHLSQLALWGQAVRLLPLWRLSGHLQHTRRPREVGKAGSPIVFLWKCLISDCVGKWRSIVSLLWPGVAAQKQGGSRRTFVPDWEGANKTNKNIFGANKTNKTTLSATKKKQEYFKCKHNKQE